MRPRGHIVASAGLGAIFWVRSRDVRTMLLSLVFGVLVDVDHLIDYWYAEGRVSLDAREFLRARYWRKSGRIFVLFHAFEYLPPLFFFWQAWRGRKWAVAATSAMSVHLVADHFVNDLRPLGYFILYRVAHRFRAAEIIDWERSERLDAQRDEDRRLAKAGKLPLGRRILTLFI